MEQDECEPINILCNTQSSDMLLEQEEMRKLLKDLNVTKSPGPDLVHPRVLYELSEILAEPLCMIYNSSYDSGKIPEGWEVGQITALFKKGKKNSAANYRPVSLTSILCKIMEK